MNPLKYSYLSFFFLLCIGFSFGHRILVDTKNIHPEEMAQAPDMDDKVSEQINGLGGALNENCQGGPCQQPCPGVSIPGIQIPGIQIPPIQVPPIQIPIPFPRFPVPGQPCAPQNCNPSPCPPQYPGPCPPYNCQPCPQEKDMKATVNEMEKKDDKNHEGEGERMDTHKDSDEEKAGEAQVHQ